MKVNFLILLLAIAMPFSFGQDIALKSAETLSAGGGTDLSSLNISKWRLGQVHTVILKSADNLDEKTDKWTIKAYPNPFEEILNLKFTLEEPGDFIIQIYDISGRKQLFKDSRHLTENQDIRLDLSTLANALYLVTVTPKDNRIRKIIKVHKH